MDALGEHVPPFELNEGQPAAGSGLQPRVEQAQRHVLNQVAHEQGHLSQEGCPKEVALQQGAGMLTWPGITVA